MNNGERFANLFRGYSSRYGRYDIQGEITPEEKVSGKAITVDQSISLDDYVDHLKGKVGIGVIPLREDNRVNFAALDIDVYLHAEQKSKKLTHADIAFALFDTPLLVTRSKSDGIHVWLFSKDGVSARLATDYLNMQAARLGVAGSEVFPKQTERVSDEDIGNWINLPYFGTKRTAVVPNKVGTSYEFTDLSLSMFLDIAEPTAESVTDDWLVAATQLPTSQRESTQELPMWFDGPPCLQSLIAGHPAKVSGIQKKFDRGDITEDQYKKQMTFTTPQLADGTRNFAFFNAGIYLRRRLFPYDTDVQLDIPDKKALGGAVDEIHANWMADTGRRAGEGLDKTELETLKKQAGKGKWGYACTKEPLKGFCNRRLCLKRKFGIGTASNDAAFAITGFTIVDTEDKQYFMNVGESRIHIPDVASLMSQAEFGKIVLNATDRMWVNMQEAQYKKMMDELLQGAEHIEGPPDSDRRAVVLNALHDFVHKKSLARGKNDSAIFSGRVIWSDDEVEAWFKFDQFIIFLQGRGLQFAGSQIAHMLMTNFGVTVRGNTHVGGRQLRPYVVNLKRLDEEIGPVENGKA